MTHIRRALPLVLLPLVLAACGSESADRSAPQTRARPLGAEPEMAYVTEVPGYTLAPQSVGVLGDRGFGGSYTGPGGGVIELRVDERGSGPAGCAEPATARAEGERTTCERDGGNWYRTTGTAHEYVREDAGRVIRVSADRDEVPRGILRQAVVNARQADDGELAEVPPKPAGGDRQGGTERGDLPTTGDGAPRDPAGLTEGTSG
ncbi:hypothetical protein [Streptomyces sp. NPDC018031]|uniref:hypothetical protein n=1 Tax=Streptomyces sp. NPDC018031 TaxID=3365033 RepID=UPI0037BC5651